MIVGIISGYFNPIHTGHLDYIEGAARKCDLLYVIVNSDHQVGLKGSKEFMDESSRLRIVGALEDVDRSMISIDKDGSVVEHCGIRIAAKWKYCPMCGKKKETKVVAWR